MDYDPDRHHRRSIRLRGYDYALPGAYFVTVCTYQRECLLGRIESGRVVLSDAGEMVRNEWFNTANIRPYIRLNEGECVIMPNHMHGIVWITDNVGAVSYTHLRAHETA
ncbi:MAG: hypothetical protein QUS33_11350, partial [Dehalococcoidia bacterium]|nr:hypothetical protein [Dehalococcoidia bacterium]